MRIAIPLATKNSAFTVFRAIAVYMLQPELVLAEFLTDYIKICLPCSALKSVSKRQLNPLLQPILSEQLFPGDMMQIDVVGPFQSPFYKYVLSGIDVFSKYLFGIPLTSAHAGTKQRH